MNAAVLAAVISAAMMACAAPTLESSPQPELLSPETVAALVSVEDTAFDKSIKFVGPPGRFEDHRPNGYVDRVAWRLRSWRDRETSALTHQLYVVIDHGDRSARHYYSASFTDRSSADALRIGYDARCFRGGCRHIEDIGIPIDDARLRAAATDRLAIRLNSRAGVETFINVWGEYIRGYLAAVDSKVK